MLKWFFLVVVMLIDIMLAAISIYILYEPQFPLWLGIPCVYIIYRVWKSQGGPIAWSSKYRKDFIENATKYGL